ncbi:MAG: SAM-dependent methyltransferase [Cyanobacteria bacterium P01_H01_bin.121]
MSAADHPTRAEDYDSFVPFTARMMAAVRARESEREDALFQDPFAAKLAGATAFQQVAEQLTIRDTAYIAVRTHLFDTFLLQAQTTQVVLLAAGLDTRAYRLAWLPGTCLYELDYANTLDFKAKVLEDTEPRCHYRAIAADLTCPWGSKLLAAGFQQNQPSVWLIEGLLMYLYADQVRSILQTVTQLAAPGSQLGLDLLNTYALNTGPYQGYFQSGWDQPQQLLADYGWAATIVEPGASGANFGRFTWEPAPATVTAIERGFFITAQKS